VWEGYSQAAADYPAPVIMLAPPGTGTELASPDPAGSDSSTTGSDSSTTGSDSSTTGTYPSGAGTYPSGAGSDPIGAEVFIEQLESLRDQINALGLRDGATPVIIALHPANTSGFPALGAWLVRPACDQGRFRITLRPGPADQEGWLSEYGWELISPDGTEHVLLRPGPPDQAGWHFPHGWQLVSPDGARRALGGTMLDRAAVQRALGTARNLPGTTPAVTAPSGDRVGRVPGVLAGAARRAVAARRLWRWARGIPDLGAPAPLGQGAHGVHGVYVPPGDGSRLDHAAERAQGRG